MKTSTILQRLFLLSLLCMAKMSFSQAPPFNVYITNEAYPSRTTFQFDIWISNSGATPLDIANLQFGIDVNTAWKNGGNITPTIQFNSTTSASNNSSMFSSGLKPTATNLS